MIYKRLILAVSLLALLSGCFPAPLLLAGAAGGTVYSTTNDTITDTFTMSKDQAFEIMIGILNKQEANIKVSSISDGKIEAQVDKVFIFISFEKVNENIIRLRISAKKYVELVPDRESAVRIYRLFIKETVK